MLDLKLIATDVPFFQSCMYGVNITHGKERHLSLLDREHARKRLQIMEEAWDDVLSLRIPLPKSRSQKDLWTRLMRTHIRHTCSLRELEVFPKGPWEYVKEVVDNGVFMDRRKV
jgi:hypothetical protein